MARFSPSFKKNIFGAYKVAQLNIFIKMVGSSILMYLRTKEK
jgi:hypothetical protein